MTSAHLKSLNGSGRASHAHLNVLHDLLVLLLADDGPQAGAAVQGVCYPDALGSGLKLGQQLRLDVLVHDEAGGGRADLPGIEEDSHLRGIMRGFTMAL